MATKRKDSKGRILRKGEGQRNDGRYMFRYTDYVVKAVWNTAGGWWKPTRTRKGSRKTYPCVRRRH